jgi:hypothetical protein
MNLVQHLAKPFMTKARSQSLTLCEFDIMWLWESQCYYNINHSFQMFCIAKVKIIKVHMKNYYLEIISWFYFIFKFYLEIFHDFIPFDVVSKTLLKIVQEFGFNLFQPRFKKKLVCSSFYFTQKQNICTNILSHSHPFCVKLVNKFSYWALKCHDELLSFVECIGG